MKGLHHSESGASSYRRIQRFSLACSTHSCLFWIEHIHTSRKMAGTNATVSAEGRGEFQPGNSQGSDAGLAQL